MKVTKFEEMIKRTQEHRTMASLEQQQEHISNLEAQLNLTKSMVRPEDKPKATSKTKPKAKGSE